MGGAIVLMYLFKLRRRRIQVPYSVLWERILSERNVRSLWHRLKRWLSLIVQLLILLFVLLALRDPRPADYEAVGRHVLLVIDTSASMAMVDMSAGADRMEAARRKALDVFDRLEPHDNVMLVRADGQVRPLTPFVRPSALVRERIVDLDYTAMRADLPAILQFAARSLTGRERPELVIVTDAAVSDSDVAAAAEIALPSSATVRLARVGNPGGNVAITAFNVRQYPSDRRNYEVFLQVRNYFDEPVTLELTLSANGRPIEQRLLEIEPGETTERFYSDLARGGSRIEGRIEIVTGDLVDRFHLDDVAYALLPGEPRPRVLVVTASNLYVEAPLLLNQNYRVTVLRPDDYLAMAGNPSEDYDVTVFNDVDLPIPEQGNFLVIHPQGESSPWTIRGTARDPIIDRFDRDDPLMRWIHGFRSVNIATAARLDLAGGDRAVARSIAGDPMIVRRETEGRRLVGLVFAVEQSDFALRVTYPLFMLNAIEWLNSGDASLVVSYRTGRAWRVPVGDTEAELAWVVPPIGAARQVDIVNDSVSIFPRQPGFFEIVLGNADADPEEVARAVRNGEMVSDETVAANLSDPLESDVAPHEELSLGEQVDDEEDVGVTLLGYREPWIYLVLAAILLLVLEWVTYNRRMTV